MENKDKKELLKQAWKEVFEVEDVADDADFFEEGGDSIKAVQLSSWLLQKGIKLDLGKIFYTPVLEQMADTLEETEPVYVPDQLLTKELIGKELNSVMNGMNEQICDPEEMQGTAQQGMNEQICDPEEMKGAAQQGMNEQICDPEEMQGAAQQGMNEQICDPNEMQGAIQHGFYQPVGVNNEFNVMMGMFQTLLAQQQTMLQMMQMMLLNMNRPAPFAPKFPVPFPQNVPAPFAGNMPNPFPGKTPMKQGMQIPPEAQEIFKKRMQKYQTRKVDKPVEKPNVIGINPAKVTRPEHSAAEVLDHVLSGIFKNGYSRTQDLFEQGLSSLDTVKIVTRCGEHGYALKMQDIYMKSTFEELVKCMKPGE